MHHQAQDRRGPSITLTSHHLVISSIIDVSIQNHIRFFHAQLAPNQHRDPVLRGLLEQRFLGIIHIVHFDPQLGKIHERKDLGPAKVCFQNGRNLLRRSGYRGLPLKSKDPDGNFLEIRASGFQEDVSRAGLHDPHERGTDRQIDDQDDDSHATQPDRSPTVKLKCASR